MKAIKTLLAVSIVAGAAGAQAAPFNVTGTQTSLVVSAPVTTVATATPSTPSFTGLWNVTTSSLGGYVTFADYEVNIDVGPGFLSADLDYTGTAATYTFSGGTLGYNSLTRTLTLTNATATYSGGAPTCTGNALVCASQPDGHLEDLDLTLVFNAAFDAFTGTIVAINDAGANGTTQYNWSFEGVEDVPLPAAAWLFGSGLVGLAGAIRRRRAAA